MAIQFPDNQVLTVYGVHLVPYHVWPFELWRCWELSRLLSHIRRAVPGPHVLAVDFNSLAPGDRAHFENAPLWVKAQTWLQAGLVLHSALRLVLGAGYVDCFRKLHPPEDGFTLPAPNPSVRLDYVFASAT